MKWPTICQNGIVLGQNEIDQEAYIPNLARSMHTQIIGATGVGKTESVILPMIFNDAQNNQAVIFIDPKGDNDTYEKLVWICSLLGRSDDLLKVDLLNPSESTAYNPLKVGTIAELKDKIVGSIVWTEEFYKKIAERILVETFDLLEHSNTATTLPVLTNFICQNVSFEDLAKKFSLNYEDDVRQLADKIKACGGNLEGLKTDLTLWSRSGFESILASDKGSSVYDWIIGKKIVYINLNTLAFEETSRRFGRLVIQDIKSAVQKLQGLKKSQRSTASIYIDEFSSVASSGFIELLNKARSAGVQLTLAHQSIGDLTHVSDSFAGQILDNTNLKIIFRQDNPDSADFFARLIGTKKSEKKTIQVANQALLGSSATGLGTTRETEEFIISPNHLRKLGRGEGLVVSKIPYVVNLCRFYSTEILLNEYEKSEQQRRKKWPNILKGVFLQD